MTIVSVINSFATPQDGLFLKYRYDYDLSSGESDESDDELVASAAPPDQPLLGNESNSDANAESDKKYLWPPYENVPETAWVSWRLLRSLFGD